MPGENRTYKVVLIGPSQDTETTVEARDFGVTDHFVTFRRRWPDNSLVDVASFRTDEVRRIILQESEG